MKMQCFEAQPDFLRSIDVVIHTQPSPRQYTQIPSIMILLGALRLIASASSQTAGSATSLVLRDVAQSYTADLSDSLPISTCSSQRSIYDIIWSCLATIFACCWVSIHPNMPSSSESGSRTALRRIELLVWGLVAPELVILWAMRQWYGARFLANRYKSQGWKKTHGHFLQMGGFKLVNADGKEDLGILTADRFDWLLATDKINFPSISEKDIQDRSKGDSLAKGLVIMQSTWFVVQCVTRFAQGLVITEIELVTLALATLNGVMYFLWWDKPLDARSPVSIYMKIPYDAGVDEPDRVFGSRNWGTTPIGATMVFSEPSREDCNGPLPSPVPSLLSLPEIAFTFESRYRNHDSQSPIGHRGTEHVSIEPRRTAIDIRSNSITLTKFHTRAFTTTQLKLIPGQVSKIRGRKPENYFFYFLNLPVLGIIKLLHRLKELGNHRDINSRGIETSPTRHIRVPTFYSTTIPAQLQHQQSWRRNAMNGIAATVGALFGAIHCAGWNFRFLSHPERILWRMSSILITGAPSFVAFFYLISSIIIFAFVSQQPHSISRTTNVLLTASGNFIGKGFIAVIIMILLYIVARLCLITLALIALRDLRAGAYAVVEWAWFIPHI